MITDPRYSRGQRYISPFHCPAPASGFKQSAAHEATTDPEFWTERDGSMCKGSRCACGAWIVNFYDEAHRTWGNWMEIYVIHEENFA